MTSTLQRIEGPGDAELIAAVRGGDNEAYGLLFERHVEAARRLARQLVRGSDADDLVSEAFAKVLTVLQRGDGPDLAFRAYLLTAVRRLHIDKMRGARPAAHHRRPDPVRPRRAVPRHGRPRVRERRGGPRLRLAPRALADGAVAHRGRGAEARRGRGAARHERQLGLRPRLPRPRGPAAGVPDHARGRARGRRLRVGAPEPRRLRPRRRLAPRRRQGRGPPRRVPALHGDLPRADRGQLQPGRWLAPAVLGGRGCGLPRLRAAARSVPGSPSSVCSTGRRTSSAGHALGVHRGRGRGRPS